MKMSKELDYIEKMIVWYEDNFSQLGKERNQEHIEQLNNIKSALQRLESIDNANPSEALKAFEDFKDISLEGFVLITPDLQRLSTIKQALLKAQEDEKKVEALKELIKNHIEFAVEKDRCYFKIKNSKGNEKSFTSYSMLDFWKEVLECQKD